MFTGLVEGVFPIVELIDVEQGRRVAIENHFKDLHYGESISIDGICLTVTDFNESVFYCTLSHETLRVTTASHWVFGQWVNVERALLASARFGGHFVLGHVDAVCRLLEKDAYGDCWRYSIAVPEKKYHRYLVEKGSVTLNGVSLTINQRSSEGFYIMLIPHTLAVTNLGKIHCGDTMNIEFDYLVKAIHSMQSAETPHE